MHDSAKLKKKHLASYEERVKRRELSREIIHNYKSAFRDEKRLREKIRTLFLSSMTSVSHFDLAYLTSISMKSVTKSILADFKFETKILYFEPSFEDIEYHIKESIKAPIVRLKAQKKCGLDLLGVQTKEQVPFKFYENKTKITELEQIIDEILSNGFLPACAFLFTLS